MTRGFGLGLGAVAAFAAVVVLLAGGGNGYSVRAYLDDAGGLRDGSVLTVGGVKVGTVDVDLAPRDRVELTLNFDDGKGPIGRDATFAIASVNLLGQKRVDMNPGAAGSPAPNGYVIPARRVLHATDLDQVLNVLDADTRDRLRILLNEAGTAVFGRRTDVMRTLAILPDDLRNIDRLLDRVKADNDTISDLVTRSDGFVSEVAAQRAHVRALVSTVGRTAQTVMARRAQLEQTVRRTPATLRTVQAFLRELEQTAIPLGPAARDIARTAPPLDRTLTSLTPFTDAARPTLQTAVDVAPSLTRLATEATPVVRRAIPVARQLSSTATELAPISDILHNSAQNLLAVINNWSRAVQGRDGISHVFRAEVSASPQILDAVLKRYAGVNLKPGRKRGRRGSSRTKMPTVPAKQAPAAPQGTPLPPLAKKVLDVAKPVIDALGSAAENLKDKANGSAPDSGTSLLDYLLKP